MDPIAAWLAIFKALFWALFFLTTARKVIEGRRSTREDARSATTYS